MILGMVPFKYQELKYYLWCWWCLHQYFLHIDFREELMAPQLCSYIWVANKNSRMGQFSSLDVLFQNYIWESVQVFLNSSHYSSLVEFQPHCCMFYHGSHSQSKMKYFGQAVWHVTHEKQKKNAHILPNYYSHRCLLSLIKSCCIHSW